MLSDPLRVAIAEGATVVTATRRLSRWIRTHYDGAQRAAGRAAWQAPDVLPLDSWLRRSWLRLRDWGEFPERQHLLSGPQARFLWRQSLEPLPSLRGALLPGDAAGACEQAWRLICTYRLDLTHIEQRGGEDTRRFAAAAREYISRAEEGAWVDPATLAQRLSGPTADALAATISVPLVFVGFDEQTPVLAGLAEGLAAAGVSVRHFEDALAPRASEVLVTRLEDTGNELQAAANWAREQIEKDSSLRVGLLFANLDQVVDELADRLEDTLSPGRLLAPDDGLRRSAWNLFLDRPLGDWPAAANALRALSFLFYATPLSRVGLLLRSPFLRGAADEGDARARLDAWLRSEGYFELTAKTLHDELAGEPRRGRPDCPVLADALGRVVPDIAQAPEKQRCDEWASLFARVLQTLGWPGANPTSEEYQTVERWQGALLELGGLDPLLGPVTGRDALNALTRIAHESSFQPETEQAPVQVMSLTDAAGLGFDACWIAGLDDAALPRPLNPNALIPTGLQRESGCPRTDAAAELAFGRRLLTRLSACADTVVMSWAGKDGDRELRPSPLIAGRAADDVALIERHGYAEAVFRTRRVERLVDARFNVAAGARDMEGGTWLLHDQSACPFRGQAIHRLHADALDSPGPGVDRRTSGLLAHRALEDLWAQWGALAALPDGAQAESEVRDVLRRLIAKLPPGERLGRRALFEIERTRLTRLIGELLEIERTRPAFTVESREAKREIRIGELPLRVRADRIDRTGDGARMVVDYKSGGVAASEWLGERLKSPQLPVYALAYGPDVAGVAVASLKAGAVSYKGLSGESLLVDGVRDVASDSAASKIAADWTALIELWRKWLTALAGEYLSGEAAVSPRDAQSCQYCHLTTLCRRHEIDAGNEVRDDD